MLSFVLVGTHALQTSLRVHVLYTCHAQEKWEEISRQEREVTQRRLEIVRYGPSLVLAFSPRAHHTIPFSFCRCSCTVVQCDAMMLMTVETFPGRAVLTDVSYLCDVYAIGLGSSFMVIVCI